MSDQPATTDANMVTPSQSRFTAKTLIVAVVAALLLGSSGSYLLLSSTLLSSTENTDGPATRSTDTSALPKVSSPNPERAGAATDSAMRYGGWQALLDTPEGMADTAGSGTGWKLSAANVDTSSFAARLAELLGVRGDSRTDDWSIQIGSTDGTGPSLWVSRDSMVSFGAYDPQRSPWTCPTPGSPGTGTVKPLPADTTSGSAPDGSPGREPAAAATCESLGKVPAADDAIENVKALFERAGVTTNRFTWTSSSDDRSVTVTATLIVDGHRTYNQLSAGVSSAGIFSLSGFAAEPVELGTYPTVGPVTAAKRSYDPRWSTLGPFQVWDTTIIQPAAETTTSKTAPSIPGAQTTTDQSPQATQPARERDGLPVITATVNVVEVTSAAPGLGQFMLRDGTLVLIPTWVYETGDGQRWAMIAVDERHVEFVKP